MALTQVPIELSSTPGIVDNSNATAITIDSSENVLVGKTSLAIANEGIVFEKGGAAEFTRDAARVMRLNRTSDDGSVLEINKDGTTVGKFQSRSGVVSTIILDPRTNGAGLTGSTNGLVPVDQTGSGTNNVELGSTSSRFNTLYLGNDIAHLDTAGNARLLYDRSSNLLGNAGTNLYGAGIYLGGTGAANKLDDYEEGTWTPVVRGSSTAGSYTYSGGYAHYTKVGRQITLSFFLENITQVTAGAGYLQIHGCPFTKASSQFFAGSVSLQSVNWNNSNSYGLVEFVTSSATSTLYVRLNGDNYTGSDLQLSELISGQSDIGGTITFFND